MAQTNAERVLDYLWSVGPNGATNAEIREATEIQSHQQVYMLTRELSGRGKIRSRRDGREHVFYIDDSIDQVLQSPGRAAPGAPLPGLTAIQFENLARQVFSARFGVPLKAGQVGDVPKLFDLVSPDGDIIGDAKYYTLVGGERLPPAKFSVIAEHVWLLEKTQAAHKFLVFGNDIEVPKRWLIRYGHLRVEVTFYYLTDDGEIIELS